MIPRRAHRDKSDAVKLIEVEEVEVEVEAEVPSHNLNLLSSITRPTRLLAKDAQNVGVTWNFPFIYTPS